MCIPTERPTNIIQPETRESVSRRFKIRRQDLDTHGYTIGCAGCDAARKGSVKNHSEACRTRLSRELAAQGDPRIVRAVERTLGTPVEPSELPAPEVAQAEEEALEEDMLMDGPGPEIDVEMEGTLYELTVDVGKAHQLAKSVAR